MSRVEGSNSHNTLKRLFKLVNFLLERGETGASWEEEIMPGVYKVHRGDDGAKKAAAARRKFNRDRNELSGLYGSAWGYDDADWDEAVRIERIGSRYVLRSKDYFMLPTHFSEEEALAMTSGTHLIGDFIAPFQEPAKNV